MSKGLFLAFVILVLAATSLAQVSTEPTTATSPGQNAPANAQNSAPPAVAPPSGTLLSVELSKSLDARKNKEKDPIKDRNKRHQTTASLHARKSKANDRIEARTATDLLAHGQIVVPRNTKIVGHVTETKARSKTSPDSMVGIIFDRMLLKD